MRLPRTGFATLFVIALFLTSSSLPRLRAKACAPTGRFANEVLVKLVSPADLSALAADYGLSDVPIAQFGSRPIYRLRILDGASPNDKAEQLQLDLAHRVIYAEPNRESESPESRGRVRWAVGDADALYTQQWAANKIRLPEAHAITRGAGITVAVLDTGVDFTHPALAGRLRAGFDFVDLDADASEEGEVGVNLAYGHGTHVAALVAMAAPEAMILPIRVLDADGRGNAWVLAEALAYALDPDGNPATNDGAQVINLSLSMLERSNVVRDVMRTITCAESPDSMLGSPVCPRDAIIVMAAGNNGSDKQEFPAGTSLKGTLSVGASTEKDATASFSNYGSWVKVAAPGEAILSAVPGGYGTWSGTSMATPLVAGAAALVRAAYPKLGTEEAAERIIATSRGILGQLRLRVDAAAAVGLYNRR